MAQRSTKEVPHFLRSTTPQGLKDKMMRLNAQLGYQNKYFDIQYVNGEWFCWYYFEPRLLSKEILKPDDEVEAAN